jgi:hypothetical protein
MAVKVWLHRYLKPTLNGKYSNLPSPATSFRGARDPALVEFVNEWASDQESVTSRRETVAFAMKTAKILSTNVQTNLLIESLMPHYTMICYYRQYCHHYCCCYDADDDDADNGLLIIPIIILIGALAIPVLRYSFGITNWRL